MSGAIRFAATALVILACTSGAQAVDIQTVTVGNPGNAGELSGASAPNGYGPDRVCGAVDYMYDIGKYEITAGQYTQFLNSVAVTDTYGLYNPSMFSDSYGCHIRRTGTSGSYAYSVGGEWANRPVNYVGWGDSARFANWVHNGQPSGAQGMSTTEDGSYYLNGATSRAALMAVVRKPEASWVIPSEDEWYKAAYHCNDGATGNYYDYPTGSDATPNNGNPEGDTGNSANCYDGDDAIGPPYWRTEVGFFGLSDSPYGTFDQGGNVWEWNETVMPGAPGGAGDPVRGLRGGSFDSDYASFLHAGQRMDYGLPTHEFVDGGFRLALVPEPGAAMLMLLLGGMATAVRRELSPSVINDFPFTCPSASAAGQ